MAAPMMGPVRGSLSSWFSLCLCASVVNMPSLPLPRGFVQDDAGGYACVEGFHLLRVRNGDEFVHHGHHFAGEAGAFVAEEDCGRTFQICLIQWRSLV